MRIARGRANKLNLAIFVAFALSAAILLSRLLISAADINNTVGHDIKPTLASINSDVALMLPVLNQTVTITGKIAQQTAPLQHDLSAIVASTADINTSAATIAQHVLAAEGSANTINKTLAAIQTGLTDVNATVLSIDAQTGRIATKIRLSRDVRPRHRGVRAEQQPILGERPEPARPPTQQPRQDQPHTAEHQRAPRQHREQPDLGAQRQRKGPRVVKIGSERRQVLLRRADGPRALDRVVNAQTAPDAIPSVTCVAQKCSVVGLTRHWAVSCPGGASVP